MAGQPYAGRRLYMPPLPGWAVYPDYSPIGYSEQRALSEMTAPTVAADEPCYCVHSTDIRGKCACLQAYAWKANYGR